MTDEDIQISAAEQGYLLAIRQSRGGPVLTGAELARRMGVSPQATSEMLRRLVGADLVSLSDQRHVGLTLEGSRVADAIYRRHALAEWLLTRSLGEADRHAVIGDLYEEFFARAMHHGHNAARRWYWQQTLRSVWPNLLRRRRHQDIAIDTHGGSLMHSTWTDLRFGWRMVRRRPLVTAVAVISLVVAMTAATVSSSWVQSGAAA